MRKEHLKTAQGADDVGFLSALIDRMVKKQAVDPARVYATGISNGGFMSFRLALELSGKIAAVAPVTAQISVALKDKRPVHPVSIMLFNGTSDPLVPYGGGHIRIGRFGKSRGQILSTDETIERFRKFNGVEGKGKVKKWPDADPDDGTTVETHTYTGGKAGSEVILVKITGGGHTWPGGKQYLSKRLVGTVSRDINASEMILDFFLKHKRH